MVVYVDEKTSLIGWRSQAVRRPVGFIPRAAYLALRGIASPVLQGPRGKSNRALEDLQTLEIWSHEIKPQTQEHGQLRTTQEKAPRGN